MIKPFNKEYWQGRIDVEDGAKGNRWHQLVSEFPKDEVNLEKSVSFIGFASEEGVRRNKGRVGAAKAPGIIRKMMASIPQMQSNISALYDYGDVVVEGGKLEEARIEQTNAVKEILKKGSFPMVLGGGHEIAFGDFIALAETYENVGVINIDAHFDIRVPNPITNSGTGFYEMAKWSEERGREFKYLCLGIQRIGNTQALFDRADSLNAKYVFADDIHEGIDKWENTLSDFLNSVDVVFLSLDIDAFDVAYAPGVSAITTNGVTPHQVKQMIRKIFKSNKVKLMDIAEVNPEFDIDNRTSKLAAHMVAEAIINL